ncbi:MAG: hypothetical protein N3G21_02315 [Candidatus Hydrogenedentes bacterium]|nr:hypothetical protein [Candidatus Hydrogenedentota bacterium]
MIKIYSLFLLLNLGWIVMIIMCSCPVFSDVTVNTDSLESKVSLKIPQYVFEICDEKRLKEVESLDKLLNDISKLENILNILKKTRNLDYVEMILSCIDKKYNLALELFPKEIEVYDEYGAFLYDYKKDILNAVKIWERGYLLSSEHPSINNNLALHYFHYGDYEKGWHHLQKALEFGKDDPNILYNSAQIYFLYRNQIRAFTGWAFEKIYGDGMEFSRRSAELASDDFEIVKDYALNFFVAFQFNLPFDGKNCIIAWQNARKVARTEDEVFYTWVNEARAWLAIGKLKEAKKCLIEAQKIRPDSEVVKNILQKIESGEIEKEIKGEESTKSSISEQNNMNNKWLSPRKNFRGRTGQNPLYKVPSFFKKDRE